MSSRRTNDRERTWNKLRGLGSFLVGPFQQLSLRLFLWLAGITVAAFAGYAYISVRAAADQWRATLHDGAERCLTLIHKSTHYSMLLNRKDDVYQIIRTVAEAEGVVGVRIYDKQGVIIASGDAAEVGGKVDLNAEACVICHDQEEPLRSLPREDRVRVFRSASGERVLGLISPIDNEPGCATAPCHAHPPENTVLGVLDVKVSMAAADAGMAAKTRQILAAATVLTLLIGLSSAAFINRLVRRPVQSLIEGTAKVASGDLGTEIRINDRSEMGQLAHAFNDMTRDLRRASEENLEWSRTLEQKILEKTEELGRTQRQVVHMEKMASLGKLAATVAHELNNPLAGILSYARLVERDLAAGASSAADREEDARYLSLICKEAGRCGDIVKNLLLFSRQESVSFALHSLNAIVERALSLVRHHLEIAEMGLEVELLEDGDDQLVCDAGQIQQALVALFVNAVEAKGDGEATLRVKLEEQDGEGRLRLTVSDDGVGIPPEALPHVFEPFFSTKDEGTSGAGLGLSVVYGIVQRHGGSIEVRSEPGAGTSFEVLLPRDPENEGTGSEGG